MTSKSVHLNTSDEVEEATDKLIKMFGLNSKSELYRTVMIQLANDTNMDVIYLPAECEWNSMTEKDLEELRLSSQAELQRDKYGLSTEELQSYLDDGWTIERIAQEGFMEVKRNTSYKERLEKIQNLIKKEDIELNDFESKIQRIKSKRHNTTIKLKELDISNDKITEILDDKYPLPTKPKPTFNPEITITEDDPMKKPSVKVEEENINPEDELQYEFPEDDYSDLFDDEEENIDKNINQDDEI